MRILGRYLRDCRDVWPIWIWPLLTALLTVPVIYARPLVERYLIDNVLLKGELGLLLPTIGLLGALWLAVSILQLVGAALRSYLGEQLSIRMQRRLFRHCEDLALAFSHRQHSARTMALFTSDIPTVANFVSTTTVLAIGSVVMLLIGAALIFSLNWQLALLVAVAPPVVTGVMALVAQPLRTVARRVQDKNSELSEGLYESLSGMREVVAFGQEESQAARVGNILNQLLRLRIRATLVGTVFGLGQRTFQFTATLAILGFGGYLVIIGQTTLGTLVAMQQLFRQIFDPTLALASIGTGIQQSAACLDRIYEVLDQRPQVHERSDAWMPREVNGTITFEHVDFAYRPDVPVLHDITFVGQAGKRIALVGPSGAGKTTVTSLIARLYDPTGGHVFLDGIDLRELTLAGLREQVGVVFQDAFLFSGTIRDNIAFGRPNASDLEITDAARAAQAWEFIERMPEGLNTQVGPRAVRLSEGQKQRLAIARVLLRNPRILILDEPTSALDARSEYLLQQAFEQLMRGRTTFIIAHRLSTIQRADQILVLDQGRLVASGTHNQLLAEDGLYRELFHLQFAPEVGEVRNGKTPAVEMVGVHAGS